ncbi:leucyl/phenylalanyl-tRNA--protein transferase [Bordetella ansorpii]|uniref:Leucyl/phenylalanyl-tRNA--protein transferase n=1 Tax=Bordetella ansorpii TaxID=288768 RepID=A0A157SGT6_9BORD|nr:leucyl/phenylalanyl-tRNA--protein transferase [Bordetella ansorpii]SAI31310.1 leucyl/phenylalanyl-tRNA--protein transferase [Bordetella ansorpii]SAI69136.1 leucyl/phenylalanyl-tRNA--protein transferase [Bordetella ansorpii]
MKLPWLEPDTPLPPPELALKDPPGLLAAGADLSTARLNEAYRNGIFPWFSEGEPVLWWSTDPRMVLACDDFAPSHSLRKRLRRIAADAQRPWPSVQVRVDTCFAEVLRQCAAPRGGQAGTWILEPMQQVYRQWHAEGSAHSIETWIDGELAGGLYGISLGRMFFGESMFARATDASKIALAYLVRFLRRHGVAWIDCQQETRHLASLGARPVDRADFLAHVRRAVDAPGLPWRPGVLDAEGQLLPLPRASLLP